MGEDLHLALNSLTSVAYEVPTVCRLISQGIDPVQEL